jgi:hypothetical protein
MDSMILLLDSLRRATKIKDDLMCDYMRINRDNATERLLSNEQCRHVSKVLFALADAIRTTNLVIDTMQIEIDRLKKQSPSHNPYPPYRMN